MPYVVERWGSRRTFVFLFLYNAVVVGLMALVMPVAVFAVLLLIRGTGFTMLNNLMDSECMSAVEENDRTCSRVCGRYREVFGSTVASYWAGYILAGNHYLLPFLLTASGRAGGVCRICVVRARDARSETAGTILIRLRLVIQPPEAIAMHRKVPQRITRRAFLATAAKVAVGRPVF